VVHWYRECGGSVVEVVRWLSGRGGVVAVVERVCGGSVVDGAWWHSGGGDVVLIDRRGVMA
jgi:hypothetical protein